MNNLELNHWSRFQKILTTFGGVLAKKPPRSSLKRQFLLVRKLGSVSRVKQKKYFSEKSLRKLDRKTSYQGSFCVF